MHLCRKAANGTEALTQIKALSEGSSPFPYDSDCMDDRLRIPFQVDPEKHANWQELVQYLQTNKKRPLLTQKLSYPAANLTEQISELCIQDGGAAHTSVWDNQSVCYIDVFHPRAEGWLSDELFNNTELLDNGIILTENFPVVENSEQNCPRAQTRLQELMLQVEWSSPSETPNWGSVCPRTTHKVAIDETNERVVEHWELHNVYGQKGLETMSSLMTLGGVEQSGRQGIIISSDSVNTNSLAYGLFNGLQVPFTWNGLRESLSHVLRNCILMPFAGTPICGSFHVNGTESALDQDLCLRWFQLALLLPFARNTYGYVFFCLFAK